ncbi:MAG: type II restriction endonuclease [Mitsuokella sp.]
MTEAALTQKAITVTRQAESAFCKFLSANDSGETGGHQVGILISRSAGRMFFCERELRDNHILKKPVRVKWQDDFFTDSCLTWYASKKELRLTRFGRSFSLLQAKYTGALFVLAKESDVDYAAFLFDTEDAIQQYLDAFGLTPAETNCLVQSNAASLELQEDAAIAQFISHLTMDFPSSYEMARAAREIIAQNQPFHVTKNPDQSLLDWIQMEYRLFRTIEHDRYGGIVTAGFSTVDDFLTLANKILNCRKSRAGKSLEHHLAALFDAYSIVYTAQGITEGKKKPDFLFPSAEKYHDISFPTEKLCTLAAKTTCKDRWRQVLNEANRLRSKPKYLCTLQQGISSAQMDEMQEECVVLVVPKPYIKTFPRTRQNRIWTIHKFVSYIKELQS